MAALDLSDLGLRATMGPVVRAPDGSLAQAFTVEDAGLQVALDNFGAAAKAFAAAYEALPVAARACLDGTTITLGPRS